MLGDPLPLFLTLGLVYASVVIVTQSQVTPMWNELAVATEAHICRNSEHPGGIWSLPLMGTLHPSPGVAACKFLAMGAP